MVFSPVEVELRRVNAIGAMAGVRSTSADWIYGAGARQASSRAPDPADQS